MEAEPTGQNALLLAARYGQERVVALLVGEHDQCPEEAVDAQGESALHWACRGHHLKSSSTSMATSCPLSNDAEKEDHVGRAHSDHVVDRAPGTHLI